MYNVLIRGRLHFASSRVPSFDSMKFPLLSRLSPRARVLVLLGAAVTCFAAAALLYGVAVFLSPPPPAFQARRSVPNTDVNPYGANFFLEREVEAWKRERTAQMARDAGIGFARQEFIWAEIEPAPDVFNWTKYDEIVELLRRNNMQIIARLDRPPAWARAAPIRRLLDRASFCRPEPSLNRRRAGTCDGCRRLARPRHRARAPPCRASRDACRSQPDPD